MSRRSGAAIGTIVVAAALGLGASADGARTPAPRGCRAGYVHTQGRCRPRVFRFRIVFSGSVSETETYSGGSGPVRFRGSDSFKARFTLVWGTVRFTVNRSYATNRCGGSTSCNGGTLQDFTSTAHEDDPNYVTDFSCDQHGVAPTFHENTVLEFNLPPAPDEPTPLVPSIRISGGRPNLTFDMPNACTEVVTRKDDGSTDTRRSDARYELGVQEFACTFESIPSAVLISLDSYVPIRKLTASPRISVRVGHTYTGSGPCNHPSGENASGDAQYRWSGTLVLTRIP